MCIVASTYGLDSSYPLSAMISHQMLQDEPVYQDLSALCAQERIPQETAIELLRFLALMLHRYNGRVPKACGLSPSAAMDHLWHLVLLNTRLNEDVAKLLGGRVEHSTDGMDDAEEEKAERQSATVAMMEKSGWKGSPSAAVWAEPTAQLGGVPVVVKTLTDEFVTPPVFSALDLKYVVRAKKDHIPICQQRLMYNGKCLEDGSILADCGVRPMSVIYLIQILKGC